MWCALPTLRHWDCGGLRLWHSYCRATTRPLRNLREDAPERCGWTGSLLQGYRSVASRNVGVQDWKHLRSYGLLFLQCALASLGLWFRSLALEWRKLRWADMSRTCSLPLRSSCSRGPSSPSSCSWKPWGSTLRSAPCSRFWLSLSCCSPSLTSDTPWDSKAYEIMLMVLTEFNA